MKLIKKRRRAQSEIITIILIILLVLAAIVIVWGVVKRTVVDTSSQIGAEAFTTNLDITQVRVDKFGSAQVNVYRGPGKKQIKALVFIFQDKNGNSVSITKNDSMPNELETKSYTFFYPSFEINKISVAPVFANDKYGIEVKEDSSATKENIYINSNGDISTNPADSGLVSWWKFDGDYQDSVGINHGVLTSIPNNNANTAGNILNLDGINDSINAGNLSLNIQNQITISAWINIKSPGSWYPSIIQKGLNDGFKIQLYDTGARPLFALKLASNPMVSRISITDIGLNTWAHIAATYNGSTTKIYINSINSPQDVWPNTGAINPTAENLGIGGRAGGSYDYNFNGSIDEVMIFNRSLSADEVKAIYNNQMK